MPAQPLSRRDWLRLSATGALAGSVSGWFENLAHAAAAHPRRRKACILLWMNGGPSQLDTFDLKPGQVNGGPVKEIATRVPGIKISEHLPGVARQADHLAIIRSMTTREADHGRASFLLRTGYIPAGPIQYPTLGSLVARELGRDDAALPNFVAIAPYRFFSPGAYGPGFLGPKYAPLVVGDNAQLFNPQGRTDYTASLRVQDIDRHAEVDAGHATSRLDLLDEMEKDFHARNPGVSTASHRTAYDRALRLMRTDARKAFDLDDEKPAVRDAYGRNLFGQGCLLARRLIERGVPFVEVTHGGVNGGAFGWDTHANNAEQVKQLCGVLDPAWSQLMIDLKERGLLDDTLIIWMGEFGRTPKINPARGRDHWPNAWSTVLAGGGIRGGQAHGRTSKDGTAVEDRPASVPDLLATVVKALGIDPEKQNNSNVGRPIRLVDKPGTPIKEIVG
ncbi:MAG: DUF1501 domain-containing protein [Gemmataceae bacterium]